MQDQSEHRYKFRTVFLFDIHLGSRNCKAKMLREFLNRVEADTIYLVGDIIDGERLRFRTYWPQEHEDVLQLLGQKAGRGTRVIYIPGNHDEGLRDWMAEIGIQRGNTKDALTYRHFEFRQEAEFVDVSGHRHRVLHGDKFDGILRPGQRLGWMAVAGDLAYDMASLLNRSINEVREFFNKPYWSFSGWCKERVKVTLDRLNGTERKLAEETLRLGYDSVFFGHTHMPLEGEVHRNVALNNDGDWVDSITALVEAENGQRRLLHWAPLYSVWQRGVKRGASSPQQVFGVLARKYGATPVPVAAESPLINFAAVARRSGMVRSSYSEIIALATHGVRAAGNVVNSQLAVSVRP